MVKEEGEGGGRLGEMVWRSFFSLKGMYVCFIVILGVMG